MPIMVQGMALLVSALATVGAYHIIRRLIVGGPSWRAGRAAAPDEERMLRIEQALESVTLEMERVSEAQRFTTRLLMERLPERQAEQLPSRTPGRIPGTITPH
jgi:cell division protein FtsL